MLSDLAYPLWLVRNADAISCYGLLDHDPAPSELQAMKKKRQIQLPHKFPCGCKAKGGPGVVLEFLVTDAGYRLCKHGNYWTGAWVIARAASEPK